MADLRGILFNAFTGRQADVSGDAEGDLRGMLMAVGGPSSRTKSGIDINKAAAALGVAGDTVRRWVRTAQTGTGQRPAPANAAALAKQSRQAATTKAGRRNARAGAATPNTSRGVRIAINGFQGPLAMGREYITKRTTTLDLSPADAEAMLTAWENGGEKGFLSWASGHWDQEYLNDWTFPNILEVEVDPKTGGGSR